VEHQVALLATARIRDQQTAAVELLPSTIAERVRELGLEVRRVRDGQATRGDLRAAYVSMAATAIICAEAADRPRAMGGTAPVAGALRRKKPTNVVQIAPRRQRKAKMQTEGQISMWEKTG
jgi:hypothetical protein